MLAIYQFVAQVLRTIGKGEAKRVSSTWLTNTHGCCWNSPIGLLGGSAVFLMSCTILVVAVDRLPGKVVRQIVSGFARLNKKVDIVGSGISQDRCNEFRSSKIHKRKRLLTCVHYTYDGMHDGVVWAWTRSRSMLLRLAMLRSVYARGLGNDLLKCCASQSAKHQRWPVN